MPKNHKLGNKPKYIPRGYVPTNIGTSIRGKIDSHNNIMITSDGQGGRRKPVIMNLYGQRFAEGYWDKVSENTTSNEYLMTAADNGKAAVLAKQRSDKFVDPYSNKYKVQLMNAFAFDYIIRQSINKRVKFVLGKSISTFVYPPGIRYYKSAQKAAEALSDAGFNEPEQRKLIDFVDRVDWITNMPERRRAMMTQSPVGGRSALFIEYFNKDAQKKYDVPEFTPAVLKPLTWGMLGNVKIDTDTWAIDTVHYKDKIFASEKLQDMPANRLIYFTRNDYHVEPNKLYYGVSDLQPIMSISRSTRYINEMDLPEINASQWSGSGYWTVSNLAFTDLQEFIKQVQKVGRHYAFSVPVDFKEIKLTNDLEGLLKERDLNHLVILSQLQTPAFLVAGYEQVPNRATADTIVTSWEESVLEDERDWLRSMLRQYYDSLISLHTGESDIFKMKARIVMEFQRITFEGLVEKAYSLEILVKAGIITPDEGREVLGYGPLRKDLLIQEDTNLDAIEDAMAEENETTSKTFRARNRNVVNEPSPKEMLTARQIISRPGRR